MNSNNLNSNNLMNDLNNQSHGTSKVDTTGFSDTGFLTQRGVLVQARMMAHDRLFHKGGTGAKSLMENRVAGWATCKGTGWCKVLDEKSSCGLGDVQRGWLVQGR